MSAPSDRRNSLPELLFDMENDVRDLTRWAATVSALSTSDLNPQDCLAVVGSAMREVAERVEKQWERAFELSRPLMEGHR